MLNVHPVYDLKERLAFPRAKRPNRSFNFLKLSLSVFAPRLLFRDTLVGEADLRIAPLVSQSEINANIPVMVSVAF